MMHVSELTKGVSTEKVFQVRVRKWSEKETDLFNRKDYTGFAYFPEGKRRELDLDFVCDLPGLRYVAIGGDVGDDSALFEKDGLRGLHLHYSSQKVADLTRLAPSLEELTLGWRRNLRIPSCPRLITAYVDGCLAEDLGFIEDQPRLRHLQVELKRNHVMSTLNAPNMPELLKLELQGGAIQDLGTLKLSPTTRSVGLHSVKDADLTFLELLPQLEVLEMDRSTVRSVNVIDGLPKLEVIDDEKTKILDGDRGPIDRNRDRIRNARLGGHLG